MIWTLQLLCQRNVSNRGEMNGDKRKAVEWGICTFCVTDNWRVESLGLSTLTTIDAIKLTAPRQQSTGSLWSWWNIVLCVFTAAGWEGKYLFIICRYERKETRCLWVVLICYTKKNNICYRFYIIHPNRLTNTAFVKVFTLVNSVLTVRNFIFHGLGPQCFYARSCWKGQDFFLGEIN